MKYNNIFEYATRNKFRYPYKGVLTTEDLWDLDVTDLNEIFKSLRSEEKRREEESLLAKPSKKDVILATKIAIVKHIVNVKLSDAKKASEEKERSDRKQKLMSILANKQDEELMNKSAEEIQQMIDEMG